MSENEEWREVPRLTETQWCHSLGEELGLGQKNGMFSLDIHFGVSVRCASREARGMDSHAVTSNIETTDFNKVSQKC